MRVENHVHVRHILLYRFEKGNTAGEAFRDINELFGEGTIGRSTVTEWFLRFKNGDTSLEDKPGRGRPSDFDDQALLDVVEEDENLTTRILAEMFNRRLSGSARPPPCSHPSQETPQKEPHRLPARQRQAPCRASSDRIDRREGLGSAPVPAILSHGSSLGLPRQPLIEKLDGEQMAGTELDRQIQFYESMTMITASEYDHNPLSFWKEQQDNLTMLARIAKSVLAIQECDNYIRASSTIKVVLVMSDTFSQSTVARLHDLTQLVCCYIVHRDNTNDTTWTNQYQKIKGVFNHHDEILERIIQDQFDRKKLEDSTSISLIPNESQSLESRNANFMWFLLYVEVLLRMNHPENAKDELIEICKKLYTEKPDELSNIDRLQREYTSDKAIWWYTEDTCFYRLLNKALRCRDFDMLFALRFFITDIARDIKREHEQFIRTSTVREPFEVYRGQFISSSELQLMLDNVGEFVSMNSFLSTSRNRKTAMSFLRNVTVECNKRLVLLEISIDPRLPTKAFADIKQLSSFSAENEVLITLGALFHIDKIFEHSQESFCVVKLSLASDNDYPLKRIFDYMKRMIGDESTLDSLGKILEQMGEHQYACKYYERMMHETQMTLANCQMGIGRAMYGIMSYENALKHYEKCLIIRERELGKDHAQVGISYSRVGAALCRQGEVRKSLTYLGKAREIQERVLPPNSLELAETYNSFGLAYFTLNELKQAASYFTKVLDIRCKVLPLDHSDIGFAYNNLGSVFEQDQQYEEALVYWKKSLSISSKTLPPTHPDVEKTQASICRVTEVLKAEQEQASPTNDTLDFSWITSLGMD
ncbi:unnamed protein product [Didymodactylos carnosus]|uniref:Mos1 transposase HTH domain-containing protein n=1 Tax=Didymodactylos carnosus TaxID=1234261 RepID=A0A814Z5L9_9BILA|nr:unnamed protein product [Didymodactylos carnosus]CAF4000710.1 unnamed protein product [Didymodactylos carnosus]